MRHVPHGDIPPLARDGADRPNMTALDTAAPGPPASTRPLRHMARWVAGSVVTAALIVTICVIIALVSFQHAETALADLNSRVVPLLTASLKLSERTAELSAGTSALLAANDQATLERPRAQQHALSAAALATLASLRPSLAPDRYVEIADGFTGVLTSSQTLASAVERRLRLVERRHDITRELNAALGQLNDALNVLTLSARSLAPHLIERSLATARREERDAPLGDARVAELARQGGVEVDLALSVKADANLLFAGIKSALDQRDMSALLDHEIALRQTSFSLRALTDRLARTEIALRNPVLVDQLYRLLRDGQTAAFGAEGVFASRRAELGLEEELEALASETRARASNLQLAVRQAVATIDTDVARAREIIARDLDASQTQLVGLAAIAAVLALVVAVIIARAVARHEATLRHALAGVEAASRAKSEFLANMSHELRTPLNAIIGFADIMKTEAFGPLGGDRYREYAGLIESAGEHLLRIISDILDISKIEAGRLELRPEPTPVGPLVEDMARLVAPRVNKGRVRFSVDVPKDQPMVLADPIRLKQILLNLLSNAIKFTPPGGAIHLATATAPGEARAVFTVTDEGIGMSPAGLRKAMRPFGQIDTPLNRAHDGTGLGLPLVVNLVRLSGGEFTIDSAEGRGTTVSFTLPLAPASASVSLQGDASAVGPASEQAGPVSTGVAPQNA